jgi:hypothetical protein
LSSSSQITNQAAEITFGSGELQGHFYIDDLRIGTGKDAILIKN